MILFLEDWKKFPTATVHMETRNKSFIRYAALLREMGVKNHAWPLALVNPDLRFVDPHDPNITVEHALMVAAECKVNPWYFFREVARAPGDSGDEARPLEANRANMALFWCFFNHILFILIQPRQTGKSFSTDVLMRLLLNIICKGAKINLLTKDDNLRRTNIERLKDIAEELPVYLRQKRYDDANNGEEITVNALGNKYSTHVPQMSPKRAINLGRGLTTPVLHIDEPPFQPNISIAMPAILAATGAARDRARNANAPYGVVLTTTAGKKDDKDGKYIYEMVCDAAVWTERFYDAATLEILEDMVRKNSRAGELMINGTFSHRQLGKTDAWLREKIETSRAKGDDANRDYFNQWTSGSNSSPFPIDIAERIGKSVRDVMYSSISAPDNYITRWYIPENTIDKIMSSGSFILGMDTSDASGGDDISFYLMNIETLKTVAVGTYNETNIISFATWICNFLVQYKTVTAIIERRSTGTTILDYLLLMLPEWGEDPFRRLFNRVVNDSDVEPERFKEIRQPMTRRPSDIFTRHKKAFGFATSGSGLTSRTDLYSTIMMAAAKRAGHLVADKSLIDQILGLVIKNGRVDHEDGEHDDLVIAWLLSHWLITAGKNLSFYGIDSSRIACDVAQLGGGAKVISIADRMKKMEQDLIRQRMTQVFEEITNERDEFVCRRLEQELRVLDRKLILEEGEIFSVDMLMNKAKDVKKAKRMVNDYGKQDIFRHNSMQSVSWQSDAPGMRRAA